MAGCWQRLPWQLQFGRLHAPCSCRLWHHRRLLTAACTTGVLCALKMPCSICKVIHLPASLVLRVTDAVGAGPQVMRLEEKQTREDEPPRSGEAQLSAQQLQRSQELVARLRGKLVRAHAGMLLACMAANSRTNLCCLPGKVARTRACGRPACRVGAQREGWHRQFLCPACMHAWPDPGAADPGRQPALPPPVRRLWRGGDHVGDVLRAAPAARRTAGEGAAEARA